MPLGPWIENHVRLVPEGGGNCPIPTPLLCQTCGLESWPVTGMVSGTDSPEIVYLKEKNKHFLLENSVEPHLFLNFWPQRS